MRDLPGDVSVTGQLTADHLQTLIDQGFKSVINNRPDNEGPMQPASSELQAAAQSLGLSYQYIPMSGALTPELLATSAQAFKDLPRPVVAFCASGMRSAALWGLAHVKDLGVDGVMNAIQEAGYNLEQIRPILIEIEQQSPQTDS